MVFFKDGRCLDPAGIGPGIGFCEAEGPDFFALCHGRDPFFFLGVGSKGQYGIDGHRVVHRDTEPQAGTDPGYFFNGNTITDGVQSRSAQVLGDLDAKIAQLCHFFDDVPREPCLLIDVACDGFDFPFAESSDRAADRPVFFF